MKGYAGQSKSTYDNGEAFDGTNCKISCSFTQELRLKTNPHVVKILGIRFSMAEFLYNAVLGEGLKRLKLLRESKEWQSAKNIPDKKERRATYKKLTLLHKYSDYDFQHFAIEVKNKCAIRDHLDTHSCQKIATRVFQNIDAYKKGIRGKPRFKRKGNISSIEGKSNDAGIRFINNEVVWKGLRLTSILDDKDEVQAHSLKCKVKYNRIVRRKINGKYIFFVQNVLEGKPFIKQKNFTENKVVGLDIGPSTIAVSGETASFLKPFCETLDPLNAKTKTIQRQLSRSLRHMNPDKVDCKVADCKVIDSQKKTKKKFYLWKISNRYKKKRAILSEIHRKKKETRKRLHGQYANEVIRLGNVIKTEKISYRGFQKMFGRSVGFRAPGLFVNILRRKAENAGGYVEEFSTKTTYLSQICHRCNTKKKKKLSERWHDCSCGVKMQRDLYSAFLARFVRNNKLDTTQASVAWEGAHLLLEQAVLRLDKTAIGKQRLASFGLSQSQSGSLVKDKSNVDEAKNVVGATPESFGESAFLLLRTPCL